MLSYVVKRMLVAVPTLLAVLTVVFFFVRIAPRDPVALVSRDQRSASRRRAQPNQRAGTTGDQPGIDHGRLCHPRRPLEHARRPRGGLHPYGTVEGCSCPGGDLAPRARQRIDPG